MPQRRVSSFVLAVAAVGVAAAVFGARPAGQAFGAAGQAQAGPAQPQQGQRGGGGGRGQTRDATATVGTGSISGSVVLGGSGTPVRRARLTLTGAELGGARPAITDDNGAFAFQALPPGRFTLTVSKAGYVNMTYGAKRPGRPGTPIQLADGQRMEKVTVTLPRGGVITGTVLDEHGEPSPGTPVRALRYVIRTGEKTLELAGTDQTDDRGMYRIFQLQPGDYMVGAVPRNMNLGDALQFLTSQVQTLVQQAQAQGVEVGGGRGGRGGAGAGGPEGGRLGGGGGIGDLLGRGGGRGGAVLDQLQNQLAQTEDQQALAYAPVYFPGTPSPSGASTVTLGLSEERGGMDFQLQLVPTARISGTVSGGPTGALPGGTQVALVSADRGGMPSIPGVGTNMARVGGDGRFSFQNVTPGEYKLQARATVREALAEGAAQARGGRGGGGRGGPGGPGGPIAQVLWASTDVSVSGQDLTGLALNLQPGMNVAGRIEFQGTATPAPTDMERVRISLVPRGQQPFEAGGGIPPAEVDATGRFTIAGVAPGRYVISAAVPPGGARGGGGGARGAQTATPAGGRAAGAGGAATGAAGAAAGGTWVLKSATIGGTDVLDFPIEIGPNQDVSNAMVTFTDRTQDLSGTIQDATGRPTADFTIILFPADKRFWMPLARRIVSARPGTDGRFAFRAIPTGDYRLTAVTDVEPGEWYDPAFLSQLQQVSIPITVGEGEKKVQDIRLAGGM